MVKSVMSKKSTFRIRLESHDPDLLESTRDALVSVAKATGMLKVTVVSLPKNNSHIFSLKSAPFAYGYCMEQYRLTKLTVCIFLESSDGTNPINFFTKVKIPSGVTPKFSKYSKNTQSRRTL